MGRHNDYRDRSGKSGKHKKRDSSRGYTPQKHHKKPHGKSHHDSHKHGKHKHHHYDDDDDEFSDSDDFDYDEYDEEKGYSKRKHSMSRGKKKQGFKENIKQKLAKKLKWRKATHKQKAIEPDDEHYEDDDDETDMYDDIEHGIKKKAKKLKKGNIEGGSSDDGILLGYPGSKKKKSRGSCFYILIILYILIGGLIIAGAVNYEKILSMIETYKSKTFGESTKPASPEDPVDGKTPADKVAPKEVTKDLKKKTPRASLHLDPRLKPSAAAKPKPSLGLEYVKPTSSKDKVPYSSPLPKPVSVYYQYGGVENSSIHAYSRTNDPMYSYLMTNPISILEEPSMFSETSEDSFMELNDIMTKEERSEMIQELNRKGKVTKRIVDLTHSSVPGMHKNNLEKGSLGTLSILNTNHINRDLIEMQFYDQVENIEESEPRKRGFFSYISSFFVKSTNESTNVKESMNANGLLRQSVSTNKNDEKLPAYMAIYFQSETLNLNPTKQKVGDQANIGGPKPSGSGIRFRGERGENSPDPNIVENPIEAVETEVAGHFFTVVKEKFYSNMYKYIGLIILAYLLLTVFSSLVRKILKCICITFLRLFIWCCCGRN